MNEKITIQRKTNIDDDMGGSTSKYVSVDTVFANVELKESKSSNVAGKNIEIREYEITFRTLADGKEPKYQDLIIWNGQKLRIMSISPDFKAGLYSCTCQLEC